VKYFICLVFILCASTSFASLEHDQFCKDIANEISEYYIAYTQGGVPAEMLIDNALGAEIDEKTKRWYIWAIVSFERIPEDTSFTKSQIQLETVIRCIRDNTYITK